MYDHINARQPPSHSLLIRADLRSLPNTHGSNHSDHTTTPHAHHILPNNRSTELESPRGKPLLSVTSPDSTLRENTCKNIPLLGVFFFGVCAVHVHVFVF